MDISVVIPAYNEEKRIVKTLKEIDAYFGKNNYSYEIIVVNDGSTDDTRKIVNDLQKTIKNLVIINNEKNKGKGFVVRQGLLIGSGKYRIFTDADNATSIDQLEKLLPFAKDFDVVIASRAIEGSVISVPQPFYRRILGNIFRSLVRIIAGLKNIKDSQCGFKLLTDKSAEIILPKCSINGLSFDVEILVLAQKMGYKIKEVPVVWVDDPHSKVTLRRMERSIFDLFNIRWNALSGRYKT